MQAEYLNLSKQVKNVIKQKATTKNRRLKTASPRLDFLLISENDLTQMKSYRFQLLCNTDLYRLSQE